jgi:hypothetical protein
VKKGSVPPHGVHSPDDGPTLAALGVLAFALTDVGHEALGHGLATLAVGDRAVLLTTCYFNSSGNPSRWIPAAGGLMNLAVGLGSLAALRLISGLDPLLRYFLVLVAAFNLFFAFGYPAYSGVARFGDWAAVTSGFEPQWLWRALLVVIAVVGYYGSMMMLARPLAPFAGTAGMPTGEYPDKARLRRITRIPYAASVILACLAGALNPNGWRTMLTAGLPAAAAAFGLTQMDHVVGSVRGKAALQVSEPLKRSILWIVAAVVVLIFFVGVLGPGIRFH